MTLPPDCDRCLPDQPFILGGRPWTLSLVSTSNNAEGTNSLKFDDIIPILTKAIQELATYNDKQAQEIARLRRDFDAYKEAHP